VHVDEDKVHIGWKPSQFAVGFAKGVVDSGKKCAALKIEDGVLDSIFGGADAKASAGAAVGEIRGTKEARLMRKVVEDFAAVPTVISAGQDVDTCVEKFISEARSDAESGSGVFAIGDDEINFFLCDDVSQAIVDDLAARGANDVTDEENTHGGSLQVDGVWLKGITGSTRMHDRWC
jgi:hypothetical protein